jgi:hypothetical protein
MVKNWAADRYDISVRQMAWVTEHDRYLAVINISPAV